MFTVSVVININKYLKKKIQLNCNSLIRNSLIEEINQNELLNKKHENIYRVLNYIEHLFILISTATGCISISAFASLVGVRVEITNSARGLKICVITAGVKKFN